MADRADRSYLHPSWIACAPAGAASPSARLLTVALAAQSSRRTSSLPPAQVLGRNRKQSHQNLHAVQNPTFCSCTQSFVSLHNSPKEAASCPPCKSTMFSRARSTHQGTAPCLLSTYCRQTASKAKNRSFCILTEVKMQHKHLERLFYLLDVLRLDSIRRKQGIRWQ